MSNHLHNTIKHPIEFRQKVIDTLNTGLTKTEVGRLFKITRKTIDDWLKLIKETGSVAPKYNYENTMLGKRFGKLLVVKKSDKPGSWLCICDCGNETTVITGSLNHNSTRSCGCIRKGRHELDNVRFIGKRFGRWMIQSLAGYNKRRHKLVYALCDCGTRKKITTNSLRYSRTQSCGCLRNEKAADRKRKDRVGLRYGKLIVEKRSHLKQGKHALWLCRCDCGNRKLILGSNLTSGCTKSCGCLKEQMLADRRSKRKTNRDK